MGPIGRSLRPHRALRSRPRRHRRRRRRLFEGGATAVNAQLRLDSHEAVAAKAQELRRSVIDMIYAARSGHPGGALGTADVLTTLFYRFINDRPEDPRWPDRDRF